MKARESRQKLYSQGGGGSNYNSSNDESAANSRQRSSSYAVEGSCRVGGWGVVEVNDDKRRWIYADDLEGLRKLKEKEKEKSKEDGGMDHVTRYEMVAKRIW